jgi:ABC-type branched-subunit amino acid transport system substrate-binding protein
LFSVFTNPLPPTLSPTTTNSTLQTISFLGKLDKVVVTSGDSTSDELDEVHNYPYFTRTVPPDSAVSYAAVEFLDSLNFQNIGVLYVNDPYGRTFKDGVVAAAGKLGIHVSTAPFEFNSGSSVSVNRAIDTLIADSGNTVNAFICVTVIDDWDLIIAKAIEEKIMGGDNVWVYTDGLSSKYFEQRGKGGSLYTSDAVVDALRGSFMI